MPRLPALLLLALTLALAACGNKGPLVLPDKTPGQSPQDPDRKKDPSATSPQPAPPPPATASADRS